MSLNSFCWLITFWLYYTWWEVKPKLKEASTTIDCQAVWLWRTNLRPAICVACAWYVIPTLPVTPAQLMRPGIGWNVSCTLGDCLTSRPEGRSQPRELWFLVYSCACKHFIMDWGEDKSTRFILQGWGLLWQPSGTTLCGAVALHAKDRISPSDRVWGQAAMQLLLTVAIVTGQAVPS